MRCASDLKHGKAPMNLNENLFFMIMIINNEWALRCSVRLSELDQNIYNNKHDK